MNHFWKLLCTMALMFFLLLPLSSQAAEGNEQFDFVPDLALATDLVIRGMSYTNDQATLYGGFDVEHESGLFVYLWAANVNMLEGQAIKPEDRANLVVGLYGGYRGDFSKDLTYEVNVARFIFPGADKDLNYDMTEFTATSTYTIQNTDFDFTYNFSPEFFYESGKAHNLDITATHTLANDFSFGGHIGWQGVSDNEAVGFEDYIHYGLSVSYPVGDFTIGLDYSNTDLDNAAGLNSDDRIYFTLSY